MVFHLLLVPSWVIEILTRYLPREKLIIFNMFCIRHIIGTETVKVSVVSFLLVVYFCTGNMRNDKMAQLLVTQETILWKENAATRQSDFNMAMIILYAINLAAAIYLNAIPLHKWTLQVQYDATSLYWWRTISFVKIEQAKSIHLKPRLMMPFEFFQAYTTIRMDVCYIRFQLGMLWGRRDVQSRLGRTKPAKAGHGWCSICCDIQF